MLNSRGGTTLVSIGVLGLLASNLNAQPAQSVAVDVSACLELETRQAQLECYGELVADEIDAQTEEPAAEESAAETIVAESAAVSVVAAPVEAEPSAEVEDELSRAERRAARRAERERQREADLLADQGDQVTATVTALRELEPNHWLITLDNDQVWRQNRPQRYALEVGNEVVLRPSSWGPSYRLSDPDKGGFIQIERVR